MSKLLDSAARASAAMSEQEDRRGMGSRPAPREKFEAAVHDAEDKWGMINHDEMKAAILAAHDAATRELRAEVERLTGLVRELAQCGVELDDPRLRYVTVQVPRSVWDDARTLLARADGGLDA